MKIDKLELKNINSYGDNLQTLTFGSDGGLILLVGGNGEGKCLSGDTEIDIDIESFEIKEKLLDFLKKR